MFGKMFLMECRQTLKSLVYYIYVVLFVLFITAQMGDVSEEYDLMGPQPGQENYGQKISTDEQDIMKKTLAGLLEGVVWEKFSTYPLGFYKGVTLNEQELEHVKEILTECTGKSYKQLEQLRDQHYAAFDMSDQNQSIMAQTSFEIPAMQDLTYAKFQTKMEEICDIIGKGSDFEKSKYENSSTVSMTYEDALQEYETLCQVDKVTGAYMRLFCDYAGIVLVLLPVFLGVSRCLRDRRAKVTEVIYSKRTSGAKILLSRYLSLVFLAFLPVVFAALLIQLPIQYRAATIHVTPDVFAFLKYTVIWLLPEIMTVLAVSFFITELTDSIASIFVQVLWGIFSLFGAATLTGDFGLRLVTRWNAVGSTNLFLEQKRELFLNKAWYLGVSAVCIALTVMLYEKKRKEGVSLFGKLFKNRR